MSKVERKMYFKGKKIIILSICLLLFTLLLAAYYRRNFYSNGEASITVWKPVFSGESYIVLGKYYNVTPPKSDFIKVHASKNFYVCWNDSNKKIGLYIGSNIIEKEGFEGVNMYTITAFFKNFRGQTYRDGKLIRDSNYLEKQSKYNIQFIEL
jgi:hypothetical protein